MPHKDPEAARAYKAAIYIKNKETILIKNKAWRDENPDKARASNTAWNAANKEHMAAHRTANKERIAAKSKEWREKNKERFADMKKAWAKANPEKVRAQRKRTRARHKNKMQERLLVWQRANKDKCSVYRKRYYRKNPEKFLILSINRRALKKGRGGKLPYGFIPRLLKEQQGLCNLCKCDIATNGYHVDHIKALSRGGSNLPDNIQLLCPPCNLKKWAH